MSERASWGFGNGDEIVPGRWAIKRLGGGTRFEVYLGVDDLLRQTVVVKLLRPDRVSSTLAALQAETRALEHLRHPIIVRAFGAELAGARPHLVLEHLEGPTLRQLVKRHGPLPVEQVVPLAVQVCSALHYMAAVGWTHLDVKPGNIVMSVTPRLVDLSIAHPLPEAAALSEPIGTRTYMAPEQCVPGVYGVPGPASDVWGLGASLHFAVTGRRPFPRGDEDAAAPADRYPQLRAEPEPLPKSVPPLVAEVIAACLRKDPDRRPTAAEVADRFEQTVAALPSRPRLGRARPRSG